MAIRNSEPPVFGRRGTLALMIGFGILASIVAGSVALSAYNAHTGEEVARTQRVRAQLFQLITRIQEAESGQRGYLLTGRELYLAPYVRAIEALPQQLETLEQEVPERSAMISRLAVRVRTKAAELQRTIALADAHDLPAALAVVQTDEGKLAMDDIRAQTDSLLASEQDRLVSLIRQINRNGRLLVLLDVLGMGLLVGVALLSVLGARRGIRALEQARSALRDSNAQIAAANAVLAGTNERLEEMVAIRTAALTAANEEIQRFAYIVSHDLRAPLVNIMGFTSELEEAVRVLGGWVGQQPGVPGEVTAAANDDLPEAIRFIRTSTGKMDRLIGAILKLSREGKRTLVHERLDMPALLVSIQDTLHHQADERGTVLTVEEVPDLTADRIAVEQVFTNVIENALKYLQPGRPGRIAVRGWRDGAAAVYEVKDNGRGIADRDRERVFELFRRAGDQTVPGEGIGLAHVRALVRRMGGDVDFQSKLGAGTTFRITLPSQPMKSSAGALDAAA